MAACGGALLSLLAKPCTPSPMSATPSCSTERWEERDPPHLSLLGADWWLLAPAPHAGAPPPSRCFSGLTCPRGSALALVLWPGFLSVALLCALRRHGRRHSTRHRQVHPPEARSARGPSGKTTAPGATEASPETGSEPQEAPWAQEGEMRLRAQARVSGEAAQVWAEAAAPAQEGPAPPPHTQPLGALCMPGNDRGSGARTHARSRTPSPEVTDCRTPST